jgi:hypothetical protein
MCSPRVFPIACHFIPYSFPKFSSSHCRHSFPIHAHFDGPGRAKFETRRFGSSFASAANPHPVVTELGSFFLRHTCPYSLVGTLPLLTLLWPIILSKCNALFWPTCSCNFSIHWVHPYSSFIYFALISYLPPRPPPPPTFFFIRCVFTQRLVIL